MVPLVGKGAAAACRFPQDSSPLTCSSKFIPTKQPHNLLQALPTATLQNLPVEEQEQGG